MKQRSETKRLALYIRLSLFLVLNLVDWDAPSHKPTDYFQGVGVVLYDGVVEELSTEGICPSFEEGVDGGEARGENGVRCVSSPTRSERLDQRRGRATM